MFSQAAIKSEARTPEIIRMFAAKQAPALRQRLKELKEGSKLGRISVGVFKRQSVEICMALKKLGEEVSRANDSGLAHSAIATNASYHSQRVFGFDRALCAADRRGGGTSQGQRRHICSVHCGF